MASDTNSRFTRRKQLNPRRKNVEPGIMPEDAPLSHSPSLEEDETMEEDDRLVIVASPTSPVSKGCCSYAGPEPRNGFHRLVSPPPQQPSSHPAASEPLNYTTPAEESRCRSPSGFSSPQPRLNGELNRSEAEKIREYLGRSDTAVIFPEPVDIAEPKREHTPADRATAAATVSGAPGPHPCPKCSLSLASESELREHSRRECSPTEGATGCGGGEEVQGDVDSSTERHVCSKCKAAFSQRAHLERHQAGHAAANNQSCQRCNKPFANVYRLQRHMLSHDESSVLRKFKCPECGKAFKFKHHLKEHIRIHSGEKPFACPNCGKRFSHSGSYSSHMTSKKCLVVNLKVRKPDVKSSRGRSAIPNSSNGHPASNNNHNNAFRTIIPKYGTQSDATLPPSAGGAGYLSDRFPFQAVGDNAPTSAMQPFLPAYASVNFHTLLASHFQSLPPYVPFPGFPDMASLIQQGLHGHSPFKEDPLSYATRAASPGIHRQHPDLVGNKDSFEDPSDAQPLGSALNAVKKILQIVDATVSKQQMNRSELSQSPTQQLENEVERKSSSSSDKEATGKTNSDGRPSSSSSRCRFCDDLFESKIDLHQHERYLCKLNRDVASSNRSSKELESVEVRNGHAWTPPRSLLLTEEGNGASTPTMATPIPEPEEPPDVKPSSEDLKALLSAHPRPKKGEMLKATREMGYPMKAAIQGWFHHRRRPEEARRTPSPSIQVPVYKPYAAYGAKISPSLPLSAHHRSPTRKEESPSPAREPAACTVDQPLDLSIKGVVKPVLAISFTSDGALNLSHKSSRLLSSAGSKASEDDEEQPTSKRWSSPLPLLPRSAAADSLADSLALRLQRNGFLLGGHSALHQALHVGGGGRSSLSPADSESHSTSDSVRDFLPDYHPKYLQGNPVLALGGGGGGVPLVVQRSPDARFPYPEEHRPGSSSDPASCSPREGSSPDGVLQPHPADLLMHGKGPFLAGDYDDAGQRSSLFKKLWKQEELDESPMSSLQAGDDGCVSTADLLDDLHGVSGAKRRKPSWKPQTPVPTCKLEADEGVYSCDQCDKTFSKQSSLARHKYEHSGQRPHKCEVCSKAFKHKHHLTEHKRLHSGEKPFQCQKCLKRFSHSGSYSQHMNHRYSYCKPYRE